jgi:hypothetical protein
VFGVLHVEIFTRVRLNLNFREVNRGPGVEVEIDESNFGKRHRVEDGSWGLREWK